MTYDVTGTINSYTGEFYGKSCWGITEDLTGNLYMLKFQDPTFNESWQVDGRRARIIGEELGISETNQCLVFGAFAYFTNITSISDASGPEPVTVNALIAAVIIIGAAAAAVGYVMYKRRPKSEKDIYQSVRSKGKGTVINRAKNLIWR